MQDSGCAEEDDSSNVNIASDVNGVSTGVARPPVSEQMACLQEVTAPIATAEIRAEIARFIATFRQAREGNYPWSTFWCYGADDHLPKEARLWEKHMRCPIRLFVGAEEGYLEATECAKKTIGCGNWGTILQSTHCRMSKGTTNKQAGLRKTRVIYAVKGPRSVWGSGLSACD